MAPVSQGRFTTAREYDLRFRLERGPARMARAYSLDLRKRVVAAVASGQTCRAVAERFGVSVASVVKWVAAVPGDRQCGGQADGRLAALRARGRAPLAADAGERSARSHIAGPDRRACRAGGSRSAIMRSGTSCCEKALRSKKACAPASRIGRTSPAGAPNGSVPRPA